MPRHLSNGNERTAGTDLFLKLGQCASVEDVLADLTKIAIEKGICLCSIRIKREGLEHEFKPPNVDIMVGKINELPVAVEGGHTQLVVEFREPVDWTAVCELKHAALLAAHRIEVLTVGGLRTDRELMGSESRLSLIDGLIGESELIRELRQEIAIAASTNLSILISGEQGTGKELVACGIHKTGRRAGKPFIDVNCGGLNPNLIESEFFGHEKGSFTGANGRKIGLFESANGGTIFLDEIGELPLQSQASLLRVLQERKLFRVGGTQAIMVDIQLIAATNRDLDREVDYGRFRSDLYDRLRGYPIWTPALRDHPADIPILIRHYFPQLEFKAEALKLLRRYGWPGNVRQLRSMVERLAAKAVSGRVITIEQVRREIDLEPKSANAKSKKYCIPEMREGEPIKEYICRVFMVIYETERIRLGSHSAVAQQLGMKRTTLYDWVAWARRYVTK